MIIFNFLIITITSSEELHSDIELSDCGFESNQRSGFSAEVSHVDSDDDVAKDTMDFPEDCSGISMYSCI